MVFFNFFAIFLEFSITGRVGTERNGTITFVFSLSHTIPAYFRLKRIHNGFFAIFLIFSITRRVGTERNDNFYLLSFSSFSTLLWLQMSPYWYFLIFFAIFLEFSIMRRVGTEWNDNFYFLPFSDFSNLFWHEMKS